MSAPSEKILHFNLGPVQGFIADARRVRDLWAGSFLLSWLSGQAMAALVEAGEKVGRKVDDTIIFPRVSNDWLFAAIQTHRNGDYPENSPYVGSLPNRFKADVTGIPGNPAQICEQAIIGSWKMLADKVWDQFFEKEVASLGKDKACGTRTIWDRQVDNFWDINWVIGDLELDQTSNSIDGQWLDRRKNWRSHFQADEPGDLCRLMGRYQELSGYHRIGGKDDQQKFWDKLREQEYLHIPSGKGRSLQNLNIGDDERLCAIALIKRLFPLIANDIIGWQPGSSDLSIINWPSVSYIAAVPWLKAAKVNCLPVVRECLLRQADIHLKSYKGETETRLFGLPENEKFFELDGHLLHEDGIRSFVKDNLTNKTEDERRAALAALLPALKGVQQEIGKPATEFYAILQVDGDQIGKLVRDYQDTVRDGLADFTKKVGEYFAPNEQDDKANPANGVLIYAGGDDVLALVPVDTVIEAATALRQKYKAAFEQATGKHGGEIKDFTMSASIVFSQYKIPLRTVLRKSHLYLEQIAKEKNGRDSLAIVVMKPGGITFDWVSCWEVEADPVSELEQIAKDGAGKNPKYSASFFYNIRERYAPLFADQRSDEEKAQANGESQTIDLEFAEPSFMASVLAAEYKKQPGNSKMGFAEAEKAIVPLLTIGQPLRRKEIPTGGWEINKSDEYNFDGALVARFMSAEGRWHLTANTNKDGEND